MPIKNLQFDVARKDTILDEHSPIEYVKLAGAGIGIGMAVNAPHAFAASAGDCLDRDRVADLVGFLLEILVPAS